MAVSVVDRTIEPSGSRTPNGDPVGLDGSSLTLERLVRIARDGASVALTPEALDRIAACRSMLEGKIAAHEVTYGINTGIGEFSEVALTDEQVEQLHLSGPPW